MSEDQKRTEPVSEDPIVGGGPCGLCGHNPACGWGKASRIWLCHTDDHSCYHRWTVYRERPQKEDHAPDS